MSSQGEKIIETTGHRIIKNGLFLDIYVKPVAPSVAIIQECTDAILALREGEEKFYVLVDPRDAVAINKEQRNVSADGFEKFAAAVAMLNNNIFVPYIFRMIIRFNQPAYYVRVFNDKPSAEEWLQSKMERVPVK